MSMSGTSLFNTRRVSNSHARDYVRGIGTVLNVRGNTRREYDLAQSADEADRRAIAGDWAVVGEDLRDAVETYRRNVG